MIDKENRCKVSVLVTFYNQEKYVDRAIKSIIDQRVAFEYEILVGDDGSTDATQSKVRQWIEKYPQIIKLYINDRNPNETYVGGFRASKNRINLLEKVTGEYFIFLDGDDYFCYENKLQRQVDILDDKDNYDCVACAHNTDMEFEDGTSKSVTSPRIKEGKYGKKEYWRRLYFHTDSLLVRSSIIKDLPLKLLENNFNDNLIMFAIMQHGNLYYIPNSWAVYLQTGDGIWTSGNVIKNQIRNMMMYDLCNQIDASLKKETDIRIAFAWLVLWIKRKNIKKDDLRQFINEIEEKELFFSEQWLNYENLRFNQRIKLFTISFSISAKRGADEVIRRIAI